MGDSITKAALRHAARLASRLARRALMALAISSAALTAAPGHALKTPSFASHSA
jgi:hypothetical protein